VHPDGHVEVVFDIDGAPNGLAFGPDGALYLCNNGGFLFHKVDGFNRGRPGVPEGYTGGRIDRLDLVTGEKRTLYTHCGEHALVGPNDIVFDVHGGFYFTDFGKRRARERDLGGVYYALADGSRIVEVAYPMIGPNGIGLSPDGHTVYAAETETGRLWAFDLETPGVARKYPFPSPHGGRLVCGLGGYRRFDSLAVDAAGNICVATLGEGGITVIAPDGRVLRTVPCPDPLTTNICFGGEDLRTAFITLSGTGQLIAMDWVTRDGGIPGLRLNYEI
jgi:gluconolactonase